MMLIIRLFIIFLFINAYHSESQVAKKPFHNVWAVKIDGNATIDRAKQIANNHGYELVEQVMKLNFC